MRRACLSPAVEQVNGGYTMVFAGETSGSSNPEIGLATSSDGVNWIVSPSSPVITNTGSPSWASAGEVPVSLLYSNGTYQLYFNGNGTGFGYATSSDWIDCTIGSTAIRSGGYTLDAAVNVIQDGQLAELSSPITGKAASPHCQFERRCHFLGRHARQCVGGIHDLATAPTTIDGQVALVAVFEDSSGHGFYGVTTDGTELHHRRRGHVAGRHDGEQPSIENGVINSTAGFPRTVAPTRASNSRPRRCRRAGLTFSGVTISGSAITGDVSAIDVTGSSTIGGGASITSAQITVELSKP